MKIEFPERCFFVWRIFLFLFFLTYFRYEKKIVKTTCSITLRSFIKSKEKTNTYTQYKFP